MEELRRLRGYGICPRCGCVVFADERCCPDCLYAMWEASDR